MSGRVLRTRRLRLEPLGVADVDALERLFASPEMRRYLFDGREVGREETLERCAESETAFREHGYGLWLVRRRDGGEAVGFAGVLSIDGMPELLYGLDPSWWGRGFATEAAARVVDHVLDGLGHERILAEVDEPNRASVRVLERLGMRAAGRRSREGVTLLGFELRADRPGRSARPGKA